MSSIVKKFLMAITGLIMVGFVLFHMLGNLQMFQGPDAINTYAHFLKTLPPAVMWGGRLFLLAAAGVHVATAIALTRENCKACPTDPGVKERVQATLSSKTMALSGSILLFFIVFHILHFTTHTIFPVYKTFMTDLDGQQVYDVYSMVIYGFSNVWIASFYIIAMGLLCMHLSHGVSSMFQSLGLRNNYWRKTFDIFAALYGWVIFIGFVSNPAAVLLSEYTSLNIFPVQDVLLRLS